MTALLITAIGGDIAQAAAAIIRKAFPEIVLHGIDIETRHVGASCVDHFSIGLRADDPDYFPTLQRIAVTSGIDFILPMSEAELAVLARKTEGNIGPAKLLWAGVRMVSIGCDKLATAEFLAQIGVPGPWTTTADENMAPLQLPCIFKLRRSAGSKAVFVCDTAEEVAFFARRFPDAVLQEHLRGSDREVTCAVYRDREGITHILQLLRRLAGGFTVWAEVIDDFAVTAQCTVIAEAIDLRGPINIQLRLTDAGPRIFEINPRLSSTVLMRDLLGFSDVQWLVEEALGRKPAFFVPPVGAIVARTYGASILARGRK